VLADPWRFADWVVGAECIRAVDQTWPAPGSRFHHRFGLGPIAVDDSTVLEEIDPPHRLVLRARARPHGTGLVVLDLRATAGGGTEITMEEEPISGLAHCFRNPLLGALVVARNRNSLLRLARIVDRETAEEHAGA
jgi:uncharacterized protein YndB with AHSA1/START domain